MTKTALTDEAIERLICEMFPPGGRAVSIRIDDGPPRRGLLYRTDPTGPFSPDFRESASRELKAPDGRTFKIRFLCSGDGYALVTWEHFYRQ